MILKLKNTNSINIKGLFQKEKKKNINEIVVFYKLPFGKQDFIFQWKIKKLLQKCNKIWEKRSNIIKIIFNSEPLYSKKYIKAEKNKRKKKTFNVILINWKRWKPLSYSVFEEYSFNVILQILLRNSLMILMIFFFF